MALQITLARSKSVWEDLQILVHESLLVCLFKMCGLLQALCVPLPFRTESLDTKNFVWYINTVILHDRIIYHSFSAESLSHCYNNINM